MTHPRLRTLTLLAATALPLAAQVPISGSLADGSGGPLLAGVVYHATASVDVAPGATLTVQPGAVVKFAGSAWFTVAGRLVVAGTATSPVVFTDLDDDAAGGDTNGNGAVPPTPARWGSLVVTASGELDARHLELRYAGYRSNAALQPQSGARVALRGGRIAESPGIDGIRPLSRPVDLTVHGVHFARLARPVNDVSWKNLPGFVGNTASDNLIHDVIAVTSTEAVSGANLTIRPENTISGVIFSGGAQFDASSSIAFEAGVVVKIQGSHFAFMPSAALIFDGTLRTLGTATSPVVFTSWSDDAFGGDSNKDGPTPPSAGAWRRVTLGAGAGGSELAHTQFRFGGWQGALLHVNCNARLRDIAILGATDMGLSLDGLAVQPRIERLDVERCGLNPIAGLRWSAVRNFDAIAIRNSYANRMVIDSSEVDPDSIVFAHNLPAAALVVDREPQFTATSSLELREGVIVKWRAAAPMTVGAGRLVVAGTADRPVVMTSWSDDEFGGDTDPSGPTTGQPGSWSGLRLTSDRPASIEHLRVRAAGGSFQPALIAASAGASLRALHVERCAGTGVSVYQLAPIAANWLIHDCRTGIELQAGFASIAHATIHSCTLYGVQAHAGWMGVVANSISWGNVWANYRDFLPGQLVYSNGSTALAGANGNLDVDPVFVDAGARNLALSAVSPCRERGERGIAELVRADFTDASRLTDANLSGNPRPDMGAFEWRPWTLAVSGQARLGAALGFSFQGPASGIGPLFFSFGGEEGQQWPGYGFLLLGSATAPVILGTILPIGSVFPLNVPAEPSLLDLPIAAQGLLVDGANLARGAFTNRWRARLAP